MFLEGRSCATGIERGELTSPNRCVPHEICGPYSVVFQYFPDLPRLDVAVNVHPLATLTGSPFHHDAFHERAGSE